MSHRWKSISFFVSRVFLFILPLLLTNKLYNLSFVFFFKYERVKQESCNPMNTYICCNAAIVLNYFVEKILEINALKTKKFVDFETKKIK